MLQGLGAEPVGRKGGVPWHSDPSLGGDRFCSPALPSGIRSTCTRIGFYLMEKTSWLCR